MNWKGFIIILLGLGTCDYAAAQATLMDGRITSKSLRIRLNQEKLTAAETKLETAKLETGIQGGTTTKRSTSAQANRAKQQQAKAKRDFATKKKRENDNLIFD